MTWDESPEAQKLFTEADRRIDAGEIDFPFDIEAELEALRDGQLPHVVTAWDSFCASVEAGVVKA